MRERAQNFCVSLMLAVNVNVRIKEVLGVKRFILWALMCRDL